MTTAGDGIIIRVKVRLRESTDPPKKIREGIVAYARQLQRDAVFGTFADFPAGYFESISGLTAGDAAAATKQLNSYAKAITDVDYAEATDENIFNRSVVLTLTLAPGPFEDVRFGLQHLIGILCGDLL